MAGERQTDQFGLPEQWDAAPDGSGISHKTQEAGERQTEPHQAEDPRMNWGPGEWFEETQRLEAEVARLRTTEPHQTEVLSIWTGPDDARKLVRYVPEAEVARLRAEARGLIGAYMADDDLGPHINALAEAAGFSQQGER